MLWDVQHALSSRAMLDDIRDARQRALVAGVLDEFERTVTPAWPRLRAQVAHTDLSVDNTVTDDAGFITGIIDFGDMSHTALMTELASVLDSLGVGREGDELFRLARLVLDGFQRRTELEDAELQVLGVLWAARSAVTIAISSWRVAQGLEEQAFAERYNAQCARMLTTIEQAGWPEVARQLGADVPGAGGGRSSLAQRRAAAFGPAMEALFYDVPVEVAHAEGVWITDTAGQRHLDVYNNVPVRRSRPSPRDRRHRPSGPADQHAHALPAPGGHRAGRAPDRPVPARARHRAAGQLRLGGQRPGLAHGDRGHRPAREASAPPTPTTGSPRRPRRCHPSRGSTHRPPPHIERWEPPDPYRGEHLDGAGFAAAVRPLRARGTAPRPRRSSTGWS